MLFLWGARLPLSPAVPGDGLVSIQNLATYFSVARTYEAGTLILKIANTFSLLQEQKEREREFNRMTY
jgi:hypothetical protein